MYECRNLVVQSSKEVHLKQKSRPSRLALSVFALLLKILSKIAIEVKFADGMYGRKKHMPLFEEFGQASQETFGSESDPNVSWDVCQNSSKSGMTQITPLFE